MQMEIEMKRYEYSIARSLNVITGIIFLSQLFMEVSRKPGFEWVIYACGGAFLMALIYAAVLVLLNARHNKEINRT